MHENYLERLRAAKLIAVGNGFVGTAAAIDDLINQFSQHENKSSRNVEVSIVASEQPQAVLRK